MELVKKITMAGILGNIKQIVKPMKEGETKDLMLIIGIANGTKEGESDFGHYIGLRGQFKVTNLISNKKYVSSVAFLPPVANDLILGQLRPDQEVEFAFIISVTESIDIQIGYFYSCKPLVEPSENNPLNLLEKKVEESLKLSHKK